MRILVKMMLFQLLKKYQKITNTKPNSPNKLLMSYYWNMTYRIGIVQMDQHSFQDINLKRVFKKV